MRLNYNSPRKSSGDPEGPDADVMENLPHTSEKQRSRLTSSLNIKVEGGSRMTTPLKTGKKKLTQNSAASEQQQQEPRTLTHKSRARGGSLPSQSDDILRALYDDPELMAAASQQKSTKSGRPKYSKKSKYLDDYPDHLKSMMDDGIPVMQWIIVLVLLGAGFYQLRKSLVGPSGSATAKAGSRKANEKGVGRKNVKQKGKKNSVKAKGKAKDNRLRSAVPLEEKPAVATLPIEDVLASEPVQKKAAKSKPVSKKKSRRQRASRKPAAVGGTIDNEAGSHESPDSVSTDGSSSTEIVPHSEEEDREIMANLTEETQLSEEDMRVDADGWQTMKVSDEEGWQTVGSGDRNRKKSESKVAKANLAETSGAAAESSADPVPPDEEKVENNIEDADAEAVKPASLDPIEASQSSGDQAHPGDEKATPLEKDAETAQSTVQPNHAENSSGGNQAPPGDEKATPLEKDGETAQSTVQPNSAENSSGGKKQPGKSSKKKKIKKKKSTASSKPAETKAESQPDGRDDTDDDEALALMLQKEEEKFALTSSLAEVAPVEEVWEEVSRKKKKAPQVPAE